MGTLTISMAIFNSYVSHNQSVMGFWTNFFHWGSPMVISWECQILPRDDSGDLGPMGYDSCAVIYHGTHAISGWWLSNLPTPLNKNDGLWVSSSVGMMTFHSQDDGKVMSSSHVPVTTNHIWWPGAPSQGSPRVFRSSQEDWGKSPSHLTSSGKGLPFYQL